MKRRWPLQRGPLIYKPDFWVVFCRHNTCQSVGVNRFDCRLSPALSARFQIAVVPFEIDVARNLNLNDRARPLLPIAESSILDVGFEQPYVIFTDSRREQLAKIC